MDPKIKTGKVIKKRQGHPSLHSSKIKTFVKNIPDYESKTYINTPLHTAVWTNNFVQAKIILNMGVDINARNFENETALHLAVKRYSHCSRILELLLNRGAALDVVNDKGDTPLHMAAKSGTLRFVKCLLFSGANINAKNYKGYTPLLIAVTSRRLHHAMMLLDHGADVSLGNLSMNTPLHIAAEQANHDMIKLLLLYNADFTTQNYFCKRPVRYRSVREYVTALIVVGLLNGDCPNERYQVFCLKEWEKIKQTKSLNLLFELRSKPYFYNNTNMFTQLYELASNPTALYEQYPIYASTIKWMFIVCWRRSCLLKAAFETLSNVFIHLPLFLPEEVMRKILEYLEDADLSTLCQLDKWGLWKRCSQNVKSNDGLFDISNK